MKGNVFVLKHKRLDNLFIVGCTEKNEEELLKEYSYLPEPYEAEYFFSTPDLKKTEKLLYESINKYRVNPDKNYFEAKLEEIEDSFSCLYSIYTNYLSEIVDGLQICGNAYFKVNRIKILENCHEKLLKNNYKFEWYSDIFKKDNKYYKALMNHEFISQKEYLAWVNQKKVIVIDKEKESEQNNQFNQEEKTGNDDKTA